MEPFPSGELVTLWSFCSWWSQSELCAPPTSDFLVGTVFACGYWGCVCLNRMAGVEMGSVTHTVPRLDSS